MAEGAETFYLLDGATELVGLRSVVWLAMRWRALRRELMGAPGYLTHRLWFAWPWTVGLTSWWADEAAAYRFAHLPEHRRVWAWAARPGHTLGGWLAHYRFVRGGPLWGNGVRVLTERFDGRVPPPTGHPARPSQPHGPRG